MKGVLVIGWCSALGALLSMIIGHGGEHSLNFVANAISTYAAQGPQGGWISVSMLLSAVMLVSLSILVSRYHVLGEDWAAHLVPIVAGISVAGLLLLVLREETITSPGRDSVAAISQQAMHNAGNFQLLYSSMVLTALLAWLAMTSGQKKTGVAIIAFAVAAAIVSGTPWPEYLGISGMSVGLSQRAMFFCFWCSVIPVFVAARRNGGAEETSSPAPREP